MPSYALRRVVRIKWRTGRLVGRLRERGRAHQRSRRENEADSGKHGQSILAGSSIEKEEEYRRLRALTYSVFRAFRALRRMVHNCRAMPETATEGTPDRAAASQELERIAASNNFRKAERCLRLLRYVIDRTIEGREGELKEYTLGVAVFERPDTFDPRTDPVVRLEARRLRLKLAEYYQQEGLEDPVVVELPKGAYVPRFRARLEPPGPPLPARLPILMWAAAAVVAICLS